MWNSSASKTHWSSAFTKNRPSAKNGPTVSAQLHNEKSETAYRILLAPSMPLPEIRPTVSVECFPSIYAQHVITKELVEQLLNRFSLGWSHYVELLSIDKPDERRFYEIEATSNNWSVRELERQIASSLYERLALSRDKEEIRRLSREGQVIEKAADIIKNPLVLERIEAEFANGKLKMEK